MNIEQPPPGTVTTLSAYLVRMFTRIADELNKPSAQLVAAKTPQNYGKGSVVYYTAAIPSVSAAPGFYGFDGSAWQPMMVEYGTSATALAAAQAAGTARTVSRSDHVHPLPTAANVGAMATSHAANSITGFAGSAANLATSQTPGTATTVSRGDHAHAIPTTFPNASTFSSALTVNGLLDVNNSITCNGITPATARTYTLGTAALPWRNNFCAVNAGHVAGFFDAAIYTTQSAFAFMRCDINGTGLGTYVNVNGGLYNNLSSRKYKTDIQSTPPTIYRLNQLRPIHFKYLREFGTDPIPSETYSFWSNEVTPSVVAANDNSAVELGMKFSVTEAGSATGVRFYKASTNTGTHVGNLWNASGTLLASVTFTNETSSGWQEALFSSPVELTIGQTYTVSYHTTVGQYSVDSSYFNTARTTGPLTASISNNGVFSYGAGGFPTDSFNNSNYWVDVIFQTQGTQGTEGVSEDKIHAGLIAEECASVFPEAVNSWINPTTGSTDIGIDYAALTAVLVKAVQELSREIDILKKRL